MKKIKLITLSAIAVSLSSCATIINDRNQDVEIKSNIVNAQVIVNNVEKGTTPTKISVKRSSKKLKIAITAPGYEPYQTELKPEISGWFWGNLILGGAIGMIVDGCTDKCWTYDDIEAKLVPSQKRN